jgi:hypothetical protein
MTFQKHISYPEDVVIEELFLRMKTALKVLKCTHANSDLSNQVLFSSKLACLSAFFWKLR